MDMDISTLDSGVICIRLSGRLDAPSSDSIGVKFSAATSTAPSRVVVDLSGVEFIASLGMRLLISGARNAKARQGEMALFGAKPLVQNVLEQMAIDQIMPIVATEAEAVQRVQAAG